MNMQVHCALNFIFHDPILCRVKFLMFWCKGKEIYTVYSFCCKYTLSSHFFCLKWKPLEIMNTVFLKYMYHVISLSLVKKWLLQVFNFILLIVEGFHFIDWSRIAWGELHLVLVGLLKILMGLKVYEPLVVCTIFSRLYLK